MIVDDKGSDDKVSRILTVDDEDISREFCCYADHTLEAYIGDTSMTLDTLVTHDDEDIFCCMRCKIYISGPVYIGDP